MCAIVHEGFIRIYLCYTPVIQVNTIAIFTSVFQIPWNLQNLLLINIFFNLVFVNSASLRFISLPACPPPADNSADRLCTLLHEGFIIVSWVEKHLEYVLF